MATIALYANKVNNMPFQLLSVKGSVLELYGELAELQVKSLGVSKDVCDLDDVISTISTATKTQERKANSLNDLYDDIIDFIDDAERIDDNVAQTINESKTDFYDAYDYLKPDCEKSGWEKFCEGCKAVGEWCAEHWEAITTLVVAVVVAAVIIVVSVATFGAGAVALAALVGAVVGFVGQLLSDTVSFLAVGLTTGEWKWTGTIQGYIGAMFGGAIGGILTLTGMPALASAGDAVMATLFTEGLSGVTGGEHKSLNEIFLTAIIDGGTAFALSGLFDAGSKALNNTLANKIPALSRLSGRGSYSASFDRVLTGLSNKSFKNFTMKTIRNGLIANFANDFIKNVAGGLVLNPLKEFVVDVTIDLIRLLPPGTIEVIMFTTAAAPVFPPIVGLRLLPLRYS